MWVAGDLASEAYGSYHSLTTEGQALSHSISKTGGVLLQGCRVELKGISKANDKYYLQPIPRHPSEAAKPLYHILLFCDKSVILPLL